MPKNRKKDINDLLGIMKKLRGPGGCPWDRNQTHASIRHNLIEETHELIDAIDSRNTGHIREELGDLLLHVVFHTEIERQKGRFTFLDVTDSICRKLIRRHPHVFRDVRVKDVGEVIRNWDTIKAGERTKKHRRHTMDKIPRSLPSLARARRIRDLAVKKGFRWQKDADAVRKVREELNEFLSARSRVRREEEFGDLLFSMISLAGRLGIDPELALAGTNRRFMRRFNVLEDRLGKQGRAMKDVSPKELLGMWRDGQVKKGNR